jgi:apolipoprotein D and lipocalin family protein
MKKGILLALSALIVAGFSQMARAEGDGRDPKVVAKVDLKRYVGRWYEVAHNSNWFQRGCVYSTAEYAIINPTTVSVHNTCFDSRGPWTDINGTATIPDPSVPAKLVVEFNIFAKGDYWITELDPNYQWAVVSGPKKNSIFILTRKAPMEPQLLHALLKRLEKKGYDIDDLVFDQY